jgi:hypothetical protein
MDHFHGSPLKFKTAKLKKKLVDFIKANDFDYAVHPTCVVTE